MPRYGLPNPTKSITSMSKANPFATSKTAQTISNGSKADIKATNPLQSKSSFSTPSSQVPKTNDYGTTPHRLGVKTLRVKTTGTKFQSGK